jgi:rubrerythrin
MQWRDDNRLHSSSSVDFRKDIVVTNVNSMDMLSRLFYLQSCSLPRYVVHASPYVAPGDEHVFERLQAVAAAQERMAGRLAETILSRRGRLPRAAFPMRFTSLHDLELRYLITLVVQEQDAMVNEIEAAAIALNDDAELQRVAQELCRRERAHLTLLKELSSNRSVELASSSWRGAPHGTLQTRRQFQSEKTPSITTAA